MKKILTTTLFLLNLILAQGVSAQVASDQYAIANGSAEDTVGSLKVNFSAHNSVNINEFLKGRELVNKVLDNIIAQGFVPTQFHLDIGITPVKMPGDLDVLKNGMLYVSMSIEEDALERALLKFFRFESITEEGIMFFIHNGANTEEFHIGKEIVLSTVAKIKASGFVFDKDNLEIGISPVEMAGEHIVEKDGKLFVSTDVLVDNLERTLLKYFVWSN